MTSHITAVNNAGNKILFAFCIAKSKFVIRFVTWVAFLDRRRIKIQKRLKRGTSPKPILKYIYIYGVNTVNKYMAPKKTFNDFWFLWNTNKY